MITLLFAVYGIMRYASLSRDEEAQLLAVCLALSPDKLIGTILFPSDDCGEFSNQFLELSAVSTNLVVSESVVIGGQRKRIKNNNDVSEVMAGKQLSESTSFD